MNTKVGVVKYKTLLEQWGSSLDVKQWLALSISSKSRFYQLNSTLQGLFLNNGSLHGFDLGAIIPNHSLFIRLYRIKKVAVRVFFRWLEARFLLGRQTLQPGTIVFKSFILENSVSRDEYTELYFGKLPRILKNLGYSTAYLVDPLTPLRRRVLSVDGLPVVSIYQFLKISELLRVYFKFILKSLFFRIDNKFLQYEMSTPGAFLSFIYYECFRNFFCAVNPKLTFYTYENNPWERMLLLARKQQKTVGVQHVPLSPSSLNHYVDSIALKNAFPDFVMSLGPASSRKLVNEYGLPKEKVVDGAGFKYQIICSESFQQTNRVHRWLVVLGVSESQFMAEYFLKNFSDFKELGDIQITFRFHPAFGPDAMGLSIPLGIIKSNRSLSADLDDTDVVFYCGSGVALEALALGKLLVYFSPRDEILSNDFLWEYSETKIHLNDSTPPKVVFETLKSLLTNDLSAKKNKGVEFLSQLIRRFDPDADSVWVNKLMRQFMGVTSDS